MKVFFKALIFFVILTAIFATANATAPSGTMKAYDLLGAHHANAGETFNLSIKSPHSDVNADNNYAVFFRWDHINYGAQTGSPKYWDLNITDANRENLNDENTVLGRIVGGACLSLFHQTRDSLDMNVIRFMRGDANTFDVNVTVPIDVNHQDMNGKAGVLELWRLTPQSIVGQNLWGYTCTQVDANARFVIGPAIVISPEFGSVDGNVTVFGYGFPTDANVRLKFKDANGAITDLNFLDVNAESYNLYAEGYNKELDWNQATYVNGSATTAMHIIANSGTQWDLNSGITQPFFGYMLRPDSNGQFDVNIRVPFTLMLAGPGGVPDNNIRVDINSGTYPANNADMNATAAIIVTPGFNMSSDENVTVGICQDANGGYGPTCKAAGAGQTFQRVSIEQAMRNGMIRNQGLVSGFQVQLKSGGTLIAQIKMNSDMNLAMGPRRDYQSSTDASAGRAKIDTSAMPEFGTDPDGLPIDANITIYNVKSTGPIPNLARNGKLCPATICKNLDLGTFSWDTVYTATDGTPSWDYNSEAGSGNLSFRVSGFSEYTAGSLFLTVTGDANAGRVYYTRDGNLTVTFTYKDTNYQDQNTALWESGIDANFAASIYLSKAQCGQHYLLYTDYNILDNNGISCTSAPTTVSGLGYSLNDNDANISTTQTCSIALDLSKYADSGDAGFTHWIGAAQSGTYTVGTTKRAGVAFPDLRRSIMGQFYIDVNISAPRSAAVGNTLCASSDRNTVINKPSIYIWDTNFMNSYGSTFFNFSRAGGSTTDSNLAIDFNVRIQDTNLSMADLNLSIYYSQTPGDKNNVLFKDLNLAFADANASRRSGGDMTTTVKCNFYPAIADGLTDENRNTNRDTNCRFYLDANSLREGRYYIDMLLGVRTDNNRGAGSWKFDVNSRISTATSDYNSTRNPAGINDTNLPVIRSLTAPTKSTGTCATITVDANDTSNIKHFLYNTTDTVASYLDNNMNNAIEICIGSSASLPQTNTYYVKVSDFMDLNSAVSTKTITFESGSGGSNPPATAPPSTGAPSGGGAGGTITPGTETILEKTITAMPSSTEIIDILTEAGYSAEQAVEMAKTAEKAEAMQTIQVSQTTSSTGSVSYSTKVTMAITNNSSKDWKNVSVVVEIPKAIAASFSEITSAYTMKVLKSDPIIEFTIPIVKAGETANIVYTVAKKITDADASAVKAPLVVGYTAVAKPVPSGPECGDGTCDAGETNANCAADCKPTAPVAPPVQPPVTPAAIDWMTIGILAIVIVVVIAVVAAVAMRKPKGKLGYK